MNPRSSKSRERGAEMSEWKTTSGHFGSSKCSLFAQGFSSYEPNSRQMPKLLVVLSGITDWRDAHEGKSAQR